MYLRTDNVYTLRTDNAFAMVSYVFKVLSFIFTFKSLPYSFSSALSLLIRLGFLVCKSLLMSLNKICKKAKRDQFCTVSKQNLRHKIKQTNWNLTNVDCYTTESHQHLYMLTSLRWRRMPTTPRAITEHLRKYPVKPKQQHHVDYHIMHHKLTLNYNTDHQWN